MGSMGWFCKTILISLYGTKVFAYRGSTGR